MAPDIDVADRYGRETRGVLTVHRTRVWRQSCGTNFDFAASLYASARGECGSKTRSIVANFERFVSRSEAKWLGWSKELTNLKRLVLAQSLGEAEFAKSLAELFDLFGDTREAFKTLQESVGVAAGSSEEYFWLLASFQEKLGFPRAASDTMLELVNTSSNLETFVKALDLLETTGRYADIDRLRFRWLSCVSRRNEPTIAFFLDDGKIYHRPEIEMVYDAGREWHGRSSKATPRFVIVLRKMI